MITIHSSNKEKVEYLKAQKLEIVSCGEKKIYHTKNTIENKKYSQTMVEVGNKLGIFNKDMTVGEYPLKVKVTARAIRETTLQACKGREDLSTLIKLLPIIEKVLNNAVLIDVEPYRHKNRVNSQKYKDVCVYLSAFKDKEHIYPVKIILNERIHNYPELYMILPVGNIAIKKEEISIYTSTPTNKMISECVTSRHISSTISIEELVRKCNKYQQKILKNIPNELLSKNQLIIKKQLRKKDARKEKKDGKSFYTKFNELHELVDTITDCLEKQVYEKYYNKLESIKGELAHQKNKINSVNKKIESLKNVKLNIFDYEKKKRIREEISKNTSKIKAINKTIKKLNKKLDMQNGMCQDEIYRVMEIKHSLIKEYGGDPFRGIVVLRKQYGYLLKNKENSIKISNITTYQDEKQRIQKNKTEHRTDKGERI